MTNITASRAATTSILKGQHSLTGAFSLWISRAFSVFTRLRETMSARADSEALEAPPPTDPVKALKLAEKASFRKRSLTLLRKAQELRSRCRADIYIVMLYEDRYYTFKSTDKSSWPPSENEIVSSPWDVLKGVLTLAEQMRSS